VGGHVGFPWIDELVSMAVKFPNFYVDTSAYAIHRLPPSFIEFMKGVGRNRVMFGTNWPMISPQTCLKGLSALGLEAGDAHNFLEGTARRVFNL
jgi:predicted TIM-barrel fold metal-dependent hydrolase